VYHAQNIPDESQLEAAILLDLHDAGAYRQFASSIVQIASATATREGAFLGEAGRLGFCHVIEKSAV
jgi:hypothetical protein